MIMLRVDQFVLDCSSEGHLRGSWAQRPIIRSNRFVCLVDKQCSSHHQWYLDLLLYLSNSTKITINTKTAMLFNPVAPSSFHLREQLPRNVFLLGARSYICNIILDSVTVSYLLYKLLIWQIRNKRPKSSDWDELACLHTLPWPLPHCPVMWRPE